MLLGVDEWTSRSAMGKVRGGGVASAAFEERVAGSGIFGQGERGHMPGIGGEGWCAMMPCSAPPLWTVAPVMESLERME